MTIYRNVINHVETEDGIEKVEENTNDILARKDNQYQGWYCWSGIQCISIKADGGVYCADCMVKKLGNVYEDDEIEVLTKPHICTRKWCTCAANLNKTKIKDLTYKECVRAKFE